MQNQPPKSVAIVVLNWNGAGVLKDCLSSLMAQSYPELRLIVVDNGSVDGSPAIVGKYFPAVRLIRNQTNLGFCAGNNQGVQAAIDEGHDYIMILNNDTVLDRDCVAALVRRLESTATAGAVSPKMLFWQPSDRICFGAGGFSCWKGRNSHIGYKAVDSPAYNVATRVGFLCGCAILARRDVWIAVGGFDELLFRSSEDVDWSLRTLRAGFELWYEPAAVLWHRESYDILRNDGMAGQMYFYTRNPLVVMWKNARWYHWLTFVPYHLLLSLKRVAAALAGRDVAAALAVARGWADFPAVAHKCDMRAQKQYWFTTPGAVRKTAAVRN